MRMVSSSCYTCLAFAQQSALDPNDLFQLITAFWGNLHSKMLMIDLETSQTNVFQCHLGQFAKYREHYFLPVWAQSSRNKKNLIILKQFFLGLNLQYNLPTGEGNAGADRALKSDRADSSSSLMQSSACSLWRGPGDESAILGFSIIFSISAVDNFPVLMLELNFTVYIEDQK